MSLLSELYEGAALAPQDRGGKLAAQVGVGHYVAALNRRRTLLQAGVQSGKIKPNTLGPNDSLLIQKPNLNALNVPKKNDGPKDIFDVVGNLGSDIADAGTGLLSGLYTTGKAGAEIAGLVGDPGKLGRAAGTAAVGGQDPLKHAPTASKAISDTAKHYEETYKSPSAFWDSFTRHPLGPILDAATVASLGLGGLAAAGTRAAEAGQVGRLAKLSELTSRYGREDLINPKQNPVQSTPHTIPREYTPRPISKIGQIGLDKLGKVGGYRRNPLYRWQYNTELKREDRIAHHQQEALKASRVEGIIKAARPIIDMTPDESRAYAFLKVGANTSQKLDLAKQIWTETSLDDSVKLQQLENLGISPEYIHDMVDISPEVRALVEKPSDQMIAADQAWEKDVQHGIETGAVDQETHDIAIQKIHNALIEKADLHPIYHGTSRPNWLTSVEDHHFGFHAGSTKLAAIHRLFGRSWGDEAKWDREVDQHGRVNGKDLWELYSKEHGTPRLVPADEFKLTDNLDGGAADWIDRDFLPTYHREGIDAAIEKAKDQIRHWRNQDSNLKADEAQTVVDNFQKWLDQGYEGISYINTGEDVGKPSYTMFDRRDMTTENPMGANDGPIKIGYYPMRPATGIVPTKQGWLSKMLPWDTSAKWAKKKAEVNEMAAARVDLLSANKTKAFEHTSSGSTFSSGGFLTDASNLVHHMIEREKELLDRGFRQERIMGKAAKDENGEVLYFKDEKTGKEKLGPGWTFMHPNFPMQYFLKETDLGQQFMSVLEAHADLHGITPNTIEGIQQYIDRIADQNAKAFVTEQWGSLRREGVMVPTPWATQQLKFAQLQLPFNNAAARLYARFIFRWRTATLSLMFRWGLNTFVGSFIMNTIRGVGPRDYLIAQRLNKAGAFDEIHGVNLGHQAVQEVLDQMGVGYGDAAAALYSKKIGLGPLSRGMTRRVTDIENFFRRANWVKSLRREARLERGHKGGVPTEIPDVVDESQIDVPRPTAPQELPSVMSTGIQHNAGQFSRLRTELENLEYEKATFEEQVHQAPSFAAQNYQNHIDNVLQPQIDHLVGLMHQFEPPPPFTTQHVDEMQRLGNARQRLMQEKYDYQQDGDHAAAADIQTQIEEHDHKLEELQNLEDAHTAHSNFLYDHPKPVDNSVDNILDQLASAGDWQGNHSAVEHTVDNLSNAIADEKHILKQWQDAVDSHEETWSTEMSNAQSDVYNTEFDYLMNKIDESKQRIAALKQELWKHNPPMEWTDAHEQELAAARDRAHQLGMEVESHDPGTEDWFNAAQEESLARDQVNQLREMKKDHRVYLLSGEAMPPTGMASLDSMAWTVNQGKHAINHSEMYDIDPDELNAIREAFQREHPVATTEGELAEAGEHIGEVLADHQKEVLAGYGGDIDAALNDPKVLARTLNETNKMSYNYTILSPFERRYVRQLIPFYGWYKFISMAAWRLPVEMPGRANLIRNISAIGKDYQDQYGPMPPWMNGSILLGQDKNGLNSLSTLGSNPFSQFFNPLSPKGVVAGAVGVGQLSPVAQALLSGMGYDPLTGGAVRISPQEGVGSDYLGRLVDTTTGVQTSAIEHGAPQRILMSLVRAFPEYRMFEKNIMNQGGSVFPEDIPFIAPRPLAPRPAGGSYGPGAMALGWLGVTPRNYDIVKYQQQLQKKQQYAKTSAERELKRIRLKYQQAQTNGTTP